MKYRSELFGSKSRGNRPRGFALVSTLMLMILLGVLAVGMLSLSAVSLRTSSRNDAMTEARANAKIALMIALGELQEEMGSDMRVSAKAAIFDQNPATEVIDGVDQPHWLASYDSWGNWLNAPYDHPTSGSSLNIRDTYTPRRENMFRRWLLSLPEGMEKNASAPVNANGWDDSNSVVLVGGGSTGSGDRETRAYLRAVGDSGRSAWWIGPENHKARIDKAKQPRSLSAEKWESAQGDTAEVGVGALPGLGALDSNAALGEKLVTPPSLGAAGVDGVIVRKHFFDLTASSRGVLASVRTGHLKKDLSLLFEKPKSALPDPYRFDAGDIREPSIRPMSPEIANKAVLYNRHFASWTRMRHFYRMYRQDSDAEARTWDGGGIKGTSAINWNGSKPYTDSNVCTYTSAWWGDDTYHRFPILTNITFILSLKTSLITTGANAGKYNLECVSTPVYVYWNPYNVELRLPNNSLVTYSYLTQVQTLLGQFFLNGSINKKDLFLDFDDDYARFQSGSGDPIIFNPGEFRIFTPAPKNIVGGGFLDILPGFNPSSFGGMKTAINSNTTKAQNPSMEITFSAHGRSGNLFNSQFGNTPGSIIPAWYWTQSGDYVRKLLPFNEQVDWFNTPQGRESISGAGAAVPWLFDDQPLPIGYFQLALKGIHDYHNKDLPWAQDWRCRNWIHAPPFYLGKGLYMSEDPKIGHTQRLDSPFEMRFGSLIGSGKDVDDVIQNVGRSAILGLDERVTAVPILELPTSPIGSLAGFAGMRVNPGWTSLSTLNPEWQLGTVPRGRINTSGNSLYFAGTKAWAYQSGVTGPGIGNSFLHPVIPRTEVYQYFDNSKSMEPLDFTNHASAHKNPPTDTKAYCDYWDHVLLLNDALWDDYFVSSLADQTRPGATVSASLSENLQKLADGEELPNSRYMPHLGGKTADELKTELEASDGYLKAAAHLMVDGMFNVNSTSVDAWHALFSGIRERQVVYRDKNGALKPVAIPGGKRIALSRFNTETTDQEGNDPEFGVTRDDGMQAWSGVRFLDDAQLRKLAEECVKQVKRRGPFLNFSEFINRRLSNDDLGTMGALQSAIDYDDATPQAGSINYDFKSNTDFMLKESHLGTHAFSTPAAAVGSRFAGIPGYVIQSDLLKPIANTLSVRDDTFRIRAYGDSMKGGIVVARAWCEAIVQRVPEYTDKSNDPEVPARIMSEDGVFSDNTELTPINRRFGRKFQIESFRWLSGSEI